MQVDVALVATGITVFLALMALAYGYGILTNRVATNKENIGSVREEFKSYQDDNRSDHQQINEKLDRIIRNGSK